jgi:hypothetical protein
MEKLVFIVQQPVNSYMKRIASTVLLGWMVLTLSACTAATEVSVQSTAFPVRTAARPSPTIVWFPPTETPTALTVVTRPPTPERKPGIGPLLLVDDFSAADPWNPAVSEDASVDVSRNRLTIAVQPGVIAFRVRKGLTFTNFYAEMTARTSLCRNGDEYGLLFRAPNNVAYYAFVLSCNGTARVERVRLGRPYSLQPAMPSADVPPGAPGEVQLGVWVSGPEMRFFLNGHYQFGLTDSSYKSGAVGAFARSVGTTPVTVLFSDLSVYEVTYLPASATPTP